MYVYIYPQRHCIHLSTCSRRFQSVIRARRWSRANAETLAEISAKPRTGGLGRCVQGGLKGADHKGDD